MNNQAVHIIACRRIQWIQSKRRSLWRKNRSEYSLNNGIMNGTPNKKLHAPMKSPAYIITSPTWEMNEQLSSRSKASFHRMFPLSFPILLVSINWQAYYDLFRWLTVLPLSSVLPSHHFHPTAGPFVCCDSTRNRYEMQLSFPPRPNVCSSRFMCVVFSPPDELTISIQASQPSLSSSCLSFPFCWNYRLLRRRHSTNILLRYQ